VRLSGGRSVDISLASGESVRMPLVRSHLRRVGDENVETTKTRIMFIYMVTGWWRGCKTVSTGTLEVVIYRISIIPE